MINKGDIATSASFGLSGRQLPFRKVTDSVINRNGIHLIRLEGDVNFSVASDFKVADTNGFIQYEELKTRVKYLENSNDENQHISSITKEPKVQLKSEERAFKAAMLRALKQPDDNWVFYKCKECGFFHVGKNLE